MRQTRARYRPAVHILVATDADYVVNDVTAALGGPDVSFTIVREGRAVLCQQLLDGESRGCRAHP